MKKILCLILLFFLSFSIMADFGSEKSILDYLKAYEIQIEPIVQEMKDGRLIILLRDNFTQREDEVIFQLTYLLKIFDFIFAEKETTFVESEIETMIYSLPLHQDFILDYEFLKCYFESNYRIRTEMLIRKVDEEIESKYLNNSVKFRSY